MTLTEANELAQLANGLFNVPREQFNLFSWKDCAAGWLPKLVPGCRLKFCNGEHCPYLSLPNFDNGYDTYTGYEAIARYFGISTKDAEWVFNPFRYMMDNSPTAVASRIRILLKRNGYDPGPVQ
jgi:hypothetical protein